VARSRNTVSQLVARSEYEGLGLHLDAVGRDHSHFAARGYHLAKLSRCEQPAAARQTAAQQASRKLNRIYLAELSDKSAAARSMPVMLARSATVAEQSFTEKRDQRN
jgi:hypothetical protein